MCIENNKTFGSYIRIILYTFEKMGTRKITGGRKFSEIKVKKNEDLLMFVID